MAPRRRDQVPRVWVAMVVAAGHCGLFTGRPCTTRCAPAFLGSSRARLCSLQRFVWEGWPVRVMMLLLRAWSSVSSPVLV